MGYSPGPDFQDILTAIEDAQLEGLIHTRDEAISWVERTYSKTNSSR
jgi:hypothetical protein